MQSYIAESTPCAGLTQGLALEERVVPHIGSQADAGLLKQVVEEMGGVDVVVDDASHRGSD
jgi:hypothetical protein